MNPQLVDDIRNLVLSDHESALREYLVLHFAELPEELQQRIFTTLFIETVGAFDTHKLLESIQSEALETIEYIERAQAELQATQEAGV